MSKMMRNLPKGCASSRGSSHVRHVRSLGGELARHANNLYMATVKHESLMNKRRSLEVRLSEIDAQLAEIRKDIREAQGEYDTVNPAKKKARRRSLARARRCHGNGVAQKKMHLTY